MIVDWTLVHSHYVLMGGFAFEPRQEKSFLPLNLTRLTLTTAAVDSIAINEPDLIPNISKEEINYKSKASALAETFMLVHEIASRSVRSSFISINNKSTHRR